MQSSFRTQILLFAVLSIAVYAAPMPTGNSSPSQLEADSVTSQREKVMELQDSQEENTPHYFHIAENGQYFYNADWLSMCSETGQQLAWEHCDKKLLKSNGKTLTLDAKCKILCGETDHSGTYSFTGFASIEALDALNQKVKEIKTKNTVRMDDGSVYEFAEYEGEGGEEYFTEGNERFIFLESPTQSELQTLKD